MIYLEKRKAWNKGLKKWWKSPGDFKKGCVSLNRGKKASMETRKKQSEAHKKLIGENSNNWKGGISKKRGYGNFYKLRYKARKKGAVGYHTLGDWETLKAQYNWICNMCGKKEPEIKLTEDHIIPLSKGGSDNIENIQPLCRSCNSKKSNIIIE